MAHESQQTRLPWTAEEDAILISLVERYGEKRWNMVANGLPGRTGKGCSHRWRTYLRPDVKHPHLEPFTEWEAAVIVQAQREMGNNWLAIAKLLLPGRSNTAVKNFWHCRLKSGSGTHTNRLIREGHSLRYLLNDVPHAERIHPVALPAFPSTAPTGQLHPTAHEAAVLELSAAMGDHSPSLPPTTGDVCAYASCSMHADSLVTATADPAATTAAAHVMHGKFGPATTGLGVIHAAAAAIRIDRQSLNPKQDLRRRASVYVQQQLALMGQSASRQPSSSKSLQGSCPTLPSHSTSSMTWSLGHLTPEVPAANRALPQKWVSGLARGMCRQLEERGAHIPEASHGISGDLDDAYVPVTLLSTDPSSSIHNMQYTAARSSGGESSCFGDAELMPQLSGMGDGPQLKVLPPRAATTAVTAAAAEPDVVAAPLLSAAMATAQGKTGAESDTVHEVFSINIPAIKAGGHVAGSTNNTSAAATAGPPVLLSWGIPEFKWSDRDMGLEYPPEEAAGAALAAAAAEQIPGCNTTGLIHAQLTQEEKPDALSNLSFQASLGSLNVVFDGPAQASTGDWPELTRVASILTGTSLDDSIGVVKAGFHHTCEYGMQLKGQQDQTHNCFCYQQELQGQPFLLDVMDSPAPVPPHCQHTSSSDTAAPDAQVCTHVAWTEQVGHASHCLCWSQQTEAKQSRRQMLSTVHPAAPGSPMNSSPYADSPFKAAAQQTAPFSPELKAASSAAACASLSTSTFQTQMSCHDALLPGSDCSSLHWTLPLLMEPSQDRPQLASPTGESCFAKHVSSHRAISQQYSIQGHRRQPMPPTFASVLQAVQPIAAIQASDLHPASAEAQGAQTEASTMMDIVPPIQSNVDGRSSPRSSILTPAAAAASAISRCKDPNLGLNCLDDVECVVARAVVASVDPKTEAGSPVGNTFGDNNGDNHGDAGLLLQDDDLGMLYGLSTPRDDTPRTRAERRSIRLLLGLLTEPSLVSASVDLLTTWDTCRSTVVLDSADAGGPFDRHYSTHQHQQCPKADLTNHSSHCLSYLDLDHDASLESWSTKPGGNDSGLCDVGAMVVSTPVTSESRRVMDNIHANTSRKRDRPSSTATAVCSRLLIMDGGQYQQWHQHHQKKRQQDMEQKPKYEPLGAPSSHSAGQ